MDAINAGMGTAFDADSMATAFGGGGDSSGVGAGHASAFNVDNFDSEHRHRTPPLPPLPSLRAAGYEEAINIILGYPAAAAAAGGSDGSYAHDLDAATASISGYGSSSLHNPHKLGALRPAEKDVLAQVRVWAPLGDLEVTRSALAGQCASIYKRILEFDPHFKFDGHGVTGLLDDQTPVDHLSLNDGDLGVVGLESGLMEEEEKDDSDDDDDGEDEDEDEDED
jgi:hypothetical protein